MGGSNRFSRLGSTLSFLGKVAGAVGSVGSTFISILAPTLAEALPGPLGGVAKKAITELLGIDKDTSMSEIEKVLATSSPETLTKLAELDKDFKVRMKELDVAARTADHADRADARQREITTKDKTPQAMGWIILLTWGGVMIALFIYEPPSGNKELLSIAFGMLSMLVGKVSNYFFGSSVGSKSKDEVIARRS